MFGQDRWFINSELNHKMEDHSFQFLPAFYCKTKYFSRIQNVLFLQGTVAGCKEAPSSPSAPQTAAQTRMGRKCEGEATFFFEE